MKTFRFEGHPGGGIVSITAENYDRALQILEELYPNLHFTLINAVISHEENS